MVKVNFIASFLLAIVMLTSCSNVAKKSIEDLTVENIQGTLLHPDDKCIGAYPRLITQDFWLSQVYRDDVNCCICVQDGDSLLAKKMYLIGEKEGVSMMKSLLPCLLMGLWEC